MKDNTSKLLRLEAVIVKNVYENESGCCIEIELPRQKHICPRCQSETERIHDYRIQRVKDLDTHGVHTYLYLRKRRYVCGACGKQFYEKSSFLPRFHRVTNRLAAKVICDFKDLHSAKEIDSPCYVPASLSLYIIMAAMIPDFRWFVSLRFASMK